MKYEYKTRKQCAHLMHTNIIYYNTSRFLISFVNESLKFYVYSLFSLIFLTNISQITFQGYCSGDICQFAKQ